MKIEIIGNGVFGTFFKEISEDVFEIEEGADTVIMAVPSSAYEAVAKDNKGKHLVNICSIQSTTTEICLKFSNRVTSIHPLFGPRTPEDKRNSMLTYGCRCQSEIEFLRNFDKISEVGIDFDLTPEKHDKIMAKTHGAFIAATKGLKKYVDDAKDIPDEYIPHSFRKIRELVIQLEDMPKGTIDSIMANPYLENK